MNFPLKVLQDNLVAKVQLVMPNSTEGPLYIELAPKKSNIW